MKARLFLIGILTLASISTVAAGPFGINMGDSIEKIESETGVAAVSQGPDIYTITPPKTHPLFELYAVFANEEHGVYLVKAISKSIDTSVYGTELKSEFMKITESIGRTYGKYDLYDQLNRGSIWDEPNDFMMGLIKKERFLFASWDTDSGAQFNEGITGIYLAASPINQTSGMLILEYHFSNKDVAEKSKKAKEDSVF